VTPRNERRPTDADKALMAGDAEFTRRNFAPAARSWEEAWLSDPRPETAYRLAEVARLDGRTEDMKRWYNALLRLDGSTVAKWYLEERSGH
jgi:hypothetical protein